MAGTLFSLSAVRCLLDSQHLLTALNWALKETEQWAVLGANGSGKTALVRLLGRQLPITSGHYRPTRDFEPTRDIALASFELLQALLQRDQRRDLREFSESAFGPGTTAIAAHTNTQVLFASHRAEERPRCINRWLTFNPEGEGYRPQDCDGPS